MWFVKNKKISANLESNDSPRVVFTHFICFTFWVYTYILVHIILSNKQYGKIKKSTNVHVHYYHVTWFHNHQRCK